MWGLRTGRLFPIWYEKPPAWTTDSQGLMHAVFGQACLFARTNDKSGRVGVDTAQQHACAVVTAPALHVPNLQHLHDKAQQVCGRQQRRAAAALRAPLRPVRPCLLAP